MQPVPALNTSQQYTILNSLPLQQHMQMTIQQQQINQQQYQNQPNYLQNQPNYVQNQPNFIQNQPGQPQNLSKVNQAQYLPQQQFINGPPPQNMIYTFQPLSPQPQRSIAQTEYNQSV